MKTTRTSNSMVRIVASEGRLILDMRNNRRYSEIVISDKQLKFFIEVEE